MNELTQNETLPIGETIELLLSTKRSAATIKAYRSDFEFIISHLNGANYGISTINELITSEPHFVAIVLNKYKVSMLDAGLSEATINRRLSAVRALLKFAHRMGVSKTDGRNLVDSEKVRSYRDTRGPSLDKVKDLFDLPFAVHGRGSVAALRDKAMLSLLFMNGLRAGELVALNTADYIPSEQRLYITGKGRGSQKEPVTLSEHTITAIDAYLDRSGHKASALFVNVARNNKGKRLPVRLSYNGLYRILVAYGLKLGLKLSPHKLRHSAITEVLKATNGNVAKAQRFSRHLDPKTVMIYDDNRADTQGELTRMLGGLV